MPEKQPIATAPDGLQRIHQIHMSFATERVISVGVQLDVFSLIGMGRRTAFEVSRAAGASLRGMQMLLDALTGIQLLLKSDGSYELSSDAARYLDRQSPEYMGSLFETDLAWNTWGRLTESVRQGEPAFSASDPAVAEQYFPVLIRTLHIIHRGPARRLAATLTGPLALRGAHRRHGLRVLDIGCGSAVWSSEIAKADSEAMVTAIDYPAVLSLAHQYVARDTLLERYTFRARDLREADFPPSSFDIVILGHVAHGENEETVRDLLIRVHHALVAGGRIVIADIIPNNERTGPLFALIYALHMLLFSDAGDTYTLAQYSDWLDAAGFSRFEAIDIGTHSPAVVATKMIRS